MPCNYKEYPANWKDLVAEKKLKHNDKCELCFAPNGELVTRNNSENKYPWEIGWITRVIIGPDGEKKLPKTKIILTVHHIDSDKKNNHPDNLLLCCQRCHLRLNIAKHRAKARATRARKKGLQEFSI